MMQHDLIKIKESFSVTKEELWLALTNPHKMRQWFFSEINEFEAKLGFETRFLVEHEGRRFPHLWKITEVSPLQKISYAWRYEGYEGDSEVFFELRERKSAVELRFTHKIYQDFPQDIPEFKKESCMAGWSYFIQERLKTFLIR